jgi:hypothetical protein
MLLVVIFSKISLLCCTLYPPFVSFVRVCIVFFLVLLDDLVWDAQLQLLLPIQTFPDVTDGVTHIALTINDTQSRQTYPTFNRKEMKKI